MKLDATHSIFASLGLSLLAASGTPPAPGKHAASVRLPSADEVVARYIETIGGRGYVGAVQSVTVRGPYPGKGMGCESFTLLCPDEPAARRCGENRSSVVRRGAACYRATRRWRLPEARHQPESRRTVVCSCSPTEGSSWLTAAQTA